MLVLWYLFEVDAAGCCQSLLVTLILTIGPLTDPLFLLATVRFESDGTSC